MKNYSSLITLCLGLFVLAALSACGGQDAELPTLFPSATPADGNGAQTVGETPLPSDISPTASGRRTLPPSWTPTQTPPLTETPIPTPVQPSPTPPANVAPQVNPACLTFAPDFAGSEPEFILGRGPRIAWTAVQGATLYRVIVTNAVGGILRDDILVEENHYTFPNDFFSEPGRYGWVVAPLDVIGNEMCARIGDSFLARTR